MNANRALRGVAEAVQYTASNLPFDGAWLKRMQPAFILCQKFLVLIDRYPSYEGDSAALAFQIILCSLKTRDATEK
jgi:hypothetical protein